MVDDALLQAAAAELDRRFGLVALWVFGSEATGRATATSDVDLAALFASRPPPAQLLEARTELETIYCENAGELAA
jgi:predicted nucleotidyltransferase